MATIRTTENGFKLIDWTDEIVNIGNTAGLITGMNLFRTQGITQTAIVFDKSYSDTTLLPQVSRRSRHATKGNDSKVETFSLPLAYFKHVDYIAPEDIQGWRRPGTPDQATAFAEVRLQKLEDMRRTVDQTMEYMRLQAVKGVTVDPEGNVLADMFSEFGLTQQVFDFELNDPATDVNKKISELKRYLASSLKTGASIQGKPMIIVGTEFFDMLTNHPQVRQAYLYYQAQFNINRDVTNQMMSWGSVDQFEYKGVIFMTYDHVFNLPNGTTEKAVEDLEGHVVPVVNDLFRGYYGPSNKLSGANNVGREMFAYEFADPKDEFYEMQVETAPLFFATQPQVLPKLIAHA